MTKRARLLREFGGHMQAQASGDKAEIRQAYVPALRTKLLAPLLERGSDGIPEVIALLDEYHLSKDDFDAIMELELLTEQGRRRASPHFPPRSSRHSPASTTRRTPPS